jgi:hypothetical protein
MEDYANSIVDFTPPLGVGDRFRSILGRECDGWQQVESVEERGVVVVNYSPRGVRGGHVALLIWFQKGTNGGGYVRTHRASASVPPSSSPSPQSL